MLRGPSVVPLTTYLSKLRYTGLFLGTLSLSWDISDRRTQSERETLEVLLTTHFPNSGVTQELTATAAALLARRSDWRLAARVVTYRGVKWAIDSFAPYKSP